MENYILKPLNIDLLWNSNFKGTGVKVGIIDDGVSNIANKIIVAGGYNCRKKINGEYGDNSGHGTAIASIIASKEFGIAPECEIYSIKVGLEVNIETIDLVIDGMRWCINNNIKIISMSFGFASLNSDKFEEICIEATKKGIILFAAAGNSNLSQGLSIPANYNSVISITNLNKNKVIAGNSSYGKAVDFCSFGDSLLSYNLKGDIINVSGTSYAVATAVGVTALLVEQNKLIKQRELYEILKNNVEKLSTNKKDLNYGYGLIKGFIMPTEYKKDNELVIDDLKKGIYFPFTAVEVPLAKKIDSNLAYVPEGESRTVKYRVTDEKIAIVNDEGFVTGKSLGRTDLVAIDDSGKVSVVKVEVVEDAAIEEAEAPPEPDPPVEKEKLFNFEELNIYALHDKGIKGKGIKIGLIGYGCIDTPLINIKQRVNIVSETNPLDANNFGTIYSSIISGVDVGIAPEAELYIVKVATKGGLVTYANAKKGVEWCINNKMDIINFDFVDPSIHKSLLEACYNNNIIAVVNAGRSAGVTEGMTSLYSVTVSYVTDEKKFIANDSAKTPKTGTFIDCVSYGYGIKVINANGEQMVYSISEAPVAQYYCNLAVAQVMAIIALIKQQNTSINNAIKVREVLPTICEILYGGKNNNTGYGLLKATLI